MTRYKAIVAYDGSAFQGFQRLSGTAPTVQGTLEAALSQIVGEPITVTGAGRTDAGVHASGQVIAFTLTSWRHNERKLLNALNATLPTELAALHLEQTDAAFHPRYAARRREYRYVVAFAPTRHPLLARTHWQLRIDPAKVDLDQILGRMNEAAALLIGTHDFGSFGAPPDSGGSPTTWRNVMTATWQWDADQYEARVAAFTLAANAFLYHQVRTTTAALVAIGLKRMTLEAFRERFQAARRGAFNKLAPPQGLTLRSVEYAD